MILYIRLSLSFLLLVSILAIMKIIQKIIATVKTLNISIQQKRHEY
jgi:hypothetical protein